MTTPNPSRATPATSVTPVKIRPRKVRFVCWVLAPALAGFFAVTGLALGGATGAGPAVFQTSDRVAMVVLGLLFAAAVLLFARPVVVADEVGVRITNVVGGYELPWQVVRAVRFDRGNAFLTLELEDDDVVTVMAVQAADKERAVTGAQQLRRLHAAARGVC